jgi:hypothetical protein
VDDLARQQHTPKVFHGRQGQVYFPGTHQRIDRLRGRRCRHIHQYRLRVDFVPRRLKAFITGWPVAAVLAFFAVRMCGAQPKLSYV